MTMTMRSSAICSGPLQSRNNVFAPQRGVIPFACISNELLSASSYVQSFGSLPAIRPRVIGKADLAKPLRDPPTTDWAARPGQAKFLVRCARDLSATQIQRVVRVPFSERVWVTFREASRLIALDRMLSQRDYLSDLEIPEETVVSITAVLLCEQPEEKEDITNTDGVVREMGLCGSGLAKGAPAILEHGIVVAKIASSYSSSGRGLDNFRKAEVCVGGHGTMLGRDRKADRPFIDDRRRDAARSAVETFPAENDPHANWPPSKCCRRQSLGKAACLATQSSQRYAAAVATPPNWLSEPRVLQSETPFPPK